MDHRTTWRLELLLQTAGSQDHAKRLEQIRRYGQRLCCCYGSTKCVNPVAAGERSEWARLRAIRVRGAGSRAVDPHPDRASAIRPLPCGANFSTDVAVRFIDVAVRFSLQGMDSGVICPVPSRFEEKAMADMEIGYFGDERLKKGGELIMQRIAERQEVCLRKLADDRAEQVKFRRFLANEAVTGEEMVAHRALLTAVAAMGRHVLAIQDTSELNYQAQRGRKRRLGIVGNGTDIGMFVHPVLAVDAESEECLGLVDAQVWRRTKRKAANYKREPIERKESFRWVKGASQAKAVLTEASMVTVMDDREGDIYEKWARLPDKHTHLLTRASRDRSLADGGRLFPILAGFPEAHRYMLELPARPGKRGARQAWMAVRFGRVRIRRPGSCTDPNAPDEIELFAIEVRELNRLAARSRSTGAC